MEFGVDKFAVLTIKRGKVHDTNGISMRNTDALKGLKDGDSYKYLGILQCDNVKYQAIKENVRKGIFSEG